MRTQLLTGWGRLRRTAAVFGLTLLPATGPWAAGEPEGLRSSAGLGAESADEHDVKRPTLYPRHGFVWPYGSGPTYGEVEPSRWAAAGVLHTAVGSFDMTRGLPALPTELRAALSFGRSHARYFVVQVHPDAFGDGTFDRLRAAIASTGGAIVQEAPVGGFVARLTAPGLASVQGLPRLIAVEPYHPAFKLSPTIGRVPLPDPVKALSEIYTLEILLFPGEDAQAVAGSLAALGAGAIRFLGSDLIVADLHRSKLPDVAALEPVRMVFEHLPVFPHAEETTTTVQTGRWNLGATPYHDVGIRGDGNGLAGTSAQILMVLDSGAQLDAGDLSDTKTSAGAAGSGHRKVLFYTTCSAFAGNGDTSGCDALGAGGFTHGHTVAATALGNATDTPTSYGGSFFATDDVGGQWALDGLAPRAKLLIYDAHITPTSGLGCDQSGPGGNFQVGTIYDRANMGSCPSCGSLKDAHNRGARVFNFSWGSSVPQYGINASRIDQFLFDHKDSMLFISAGNDGRDSNSDGVLDDRIGDPATCKSCVVVGSVGNADDTGSGTAPDERSPFSSGGPATSTSKRVAPLLMAPGQERGSMGMDSEFNCRSSDNDQANPVECDIVEGVAGTSFSSPAAAGAALLVRDYFAQGFYPDGTSTNPGNAADQEPILSGALIKAALVASAEWVGPAPAPPTFNDPGLNLNVRYRFNNEQGYGRIQLNRSLPLTTYPSPTGLIVADGGIAGGPNDTTLSGTANPNTTETTTVRVCDNSQDLSVGLAWVEDQGESLSRDLDLELVTPSGKTYFGNYYTDDEDKDLPTPTLDLGENCDYAGPWPLASIALVDQSPWSLPTCPDSSHDAQNPVEGIHLSADPRGNGVFDDPATTGTNEGADNQIETGDWTLRVIGRSFASGQPYALAVAGPVCLGSSVRIQILKRDGTLGSGNFVCNDRAQVIVNEVGEATDPAIGLTEEEIATRTTVRVWGVGPNGTFDGGTGDDVLLDEESGLIFTDADGAGAGLRFESSVMVLTDGTTPDPGNMALDIRSGNFLQVVYQDETSGSPDPDKKRINVAKVDCEAKVAFGGIVFPQFGRDASTVISGGCDRDERGMFTFGFPDKYMDAGEELIYSIAFLQSDAETLEDVEASLRCVDVDADSPATCKPGTTDCADPGRVNNPVCTHLTISDSPKGIGPVQANAAVGVNFAVRMATSISGTPEIEMVLGISARKSGRPFSGLAIARHVLDVDEVSFFYQTDCPTGCLESRDVDNNESIQQRTTDPVDFSEDYVDEQVQWLDLTATGYNSATALESPWNFDTATAGGFHGSSSAFSVVLHNATNRNTLATISQWGEDMNGNGILDPGEDRDLANLTLDQSWSTAGGCGWQSKGAGTTGGVWHTGRIGDTVTPECLVAGGTPARCQKYETFPGTGGASLWWEQLRTPVFKKVNQCPAGGPPTCLGREDQPGKPVFTVEFLGMEWNAALDLQDRLTALAWHLDTDADKIEPIDLINGGVFNLIGFSKHGALAGGNAPLTDGYPLFSNISKCVDTDGDPSGTPDHCGFAGGTACTSDAQCTGVDINGTLGNNRVGDNNCSFEVAGVKTPFGLAGPADDDVRNGWCRHTSCSNDRARPCAQNADCVPPGLCDGALPPTPGSPADDRSRACTAASVSNVCNVAGYVTTCQLDAGTTLDQFVTANGPIRNMNIGQVNGPDMRLLTLEDFFGDSGSSFQGALGFLVVEPTFFDPAIGGYGAAVDDLNIQWREFRLDKDTTSCASSGACASVNVQSQNYFEGSSLIAITVVDSSPYEPTLNVNDCNDDGDFIDIGTDDQDCDDNGITDVRVKVQNDSTLAPDIEFVPLNRVGTTSEYRGAVPISTSYNVPGTLFVAQNGLDEPFLRVEYLDRNDGTGSRCKNDPDPAKHGLVFAGTSVFPSIGRVGVTKVRLQDDCAGCDNDGFADTGETVKAFLTFDNKSGRDLEDITVTLDTNDTDRIECISKPVIALGSLTNQQIREQTDPFVFRVSPTANRVGVNDVFTATLFVTLRSNKFDALDRTTSYTLDLDLNASGTCTPTTFSEGFEVSSGYGQFTSMALDGAGTQGGHRCQYNDPAGPNPNEADRLNCVPGPNPQTFDWHVHQTTQADGGRAYSGMRSLHWGVHPTGGPKEDTARFQQLDALRTTNPVNIGLSSPELKFKHQVSLLDNRCTNTPDGEAADRGVVHVQLADGGGNAIGNWTKLFPYENFYDAQGTDNFSNCTFDPVDDGNDEDSYFDPSDPLRRLGPSSTCFPEFVFAYQGDTDSRNPASPDRLGRASDGPGLRGAIDRGTWIEPRFNLDRFKGRRLRVRFLISSIEVYPNSTEDQLGFPDWTTCDDGWYVDDVEIVGACSSALTLSVDTKPAPAGGCSTCGSLFATLSADDNTLDAPGQVVSLSAANSFVDNCKDGVLQFLFFDDQNLNNFFDAGTETLFRDWTDNPIYLDAPTEDTNYGVRVRCSSAPSCGGITSTTAFVAVGCPSSDTQFDPPFSETIHVDKPTLTGAEPDASATVSWTSSATVDAIQGDLALLRSSGGNFTDTVQVCIGNNLTTTTIGDATPPGGGLYYLVRSSGAFCNRPGTWSTGHAKEAAGRNGEIVADSNNCP